MSRPNFQRARLIERIDFSEELGLFRFRPEGPFTFQPGQYATLALADGDHLIQRPYSIVSSPYEPFLEFFLELVPAGALTSRLWELKVQDEVLIRNRMVGKFTLDETSGMKFHAMSATVTGVAPYVSIARTLRVDLERGKSAGHQLAVIHGASRSSEFGVYHDELAALAREGWLTYIPTISRPWEDTDWSGETGRVEDVVRKHFDRLVFDHTNAVGYACGHPQMIENVKGILMRAGFPKERIREEKFFVITATSDSSDESE
ncbi:MAG: ferredoxin--NADP reductase [Blastocatellia bacterium]